MNIDLDDPNLTAFALGELSGADQEAMEEAVAQSAEAQARVEEIQALAGRLRGEFRLDLQHAAEKRLSILSLLEQGNLWRDWRWVSLAAAAVVAVGAIVAAVALSGRSTPAGFAQKESRAAGKERVVQMEVDVAEPDLLASNAGPPAASAGGGSTPAPDGRAGENLFASATSQPASTFPIVVDTAAYAKVRKAIKSGSRPPKQAVEIEQLINYFDYDYPQPEADRPFAINLDATTCPWQPGHQLVRVGLQGREIQNENRGASNLVFLLDVSGSMQAAGALPLVKSGMRSLVDRLTENDRVAFVLYAGASGVALPSTRGDRKEEILRALDELEAGALTGGIEGIELAYRIAAENFIPGGVNRVIVATDGELNVGVASQRELVRLAKKKAGTGVSLTMLRVGNDAASVAAMQKVARKAGGNYAHIDSLPSARSVLLQQINGTLATIARDVEIEVVFNPERVASYRLIGYENAGRGKAAVSGHELNGGDIAAGHAVTALYQVVPKGVPPEPASSAGTASPQLVTVKLRHKRPDGSGALTTEHSLDGDVVEWTQAPADFRFAAAVAQFGMILRDSPHKGNGTLAGVLDVAQDAKGADPGGYRAGFVELVREAQALAF
jgi:Ca-activated chloride channel family protein